MDTDTVIGTGRGASMDTATSTCGDVFLYFTDSTSITNEDHETLRSSPKSLLIVVANHFIERERGHTCVYLNLRRKKLL